MLDPVLRFSDVVFALDTAPKALRNWLQRDQVALFSAVPEGSGWRRFCLADVAVLSIVRKLVDFGINVETASSIAVTLLTHMQGEKWLQSTDTGFPLFWVNRYVILIPEGGEAEPGDATGWALQIVNGWERQARPPAVAFLTLIPKPVLERAFTRAITGDEAEQPSLASNYIGPPLDDAGNPLETGPTIPLSDAPVRDGPLPRGIRRAAALLDGGPVAAPETSVETTPALPQKDLSS